MGVLLVPLKTLKCVRVTVEIASPPCSFWEGGHICWVQLVFGEATHLICGKAAFLGGTSPFVSCKAHFVFGGSPNLLFGEITVCWVLWVEHHHLLRGTPPPSHVFGKFTNCVGDISYLLGGA